MPVGTIDVDGARWFATFAKLVKQRNGGGGGGLGLLIAKASDCSVM